MSHSPCLFTRDLLPEFSSLRRAARQQAAWMGESHVIEETSLEENINNNNNINNNVVSCSPMKKTPPWIRALQHFVELESTIQLKMERLQIQQRSFLQPKFSLNEEEEIEQQQQIEHHAQEVQKLLKELERMIMSGMRPHDPDSKDEQIASENAKKHLSSRLSQLIQEFREGQEFYAGELKRYEAKKKRYRQIGSNEVHERIEREEKIAQYLELGYTQADIQELLVEEAKQQQVSREIQEILTNIMELHEMFRDLGAMVVEQGSVLDRIDYNVQQTQLDVKKGLAELKKAEERQKACQIM